MARLTCKWGEQLSNSNHPEIEYKVFSDDDWNVLIDRTEKGEKPLDFDGNSVHFWKCQNCGRLYFFNDTSDTPVATYKLKINIPYYMVLSH